MGIIEYFGLVILLTLLISIWRSIAISNTMTFTPEESQETQPWQYKPHQCKLARYDYTREFDKDNQRWIITLKNTEYDIVSYVYREDIINKGTTLKSALEELLPKMKALEKTYKDLEHFSIHDNCCGEKGVGDNDLP